ncbi:hypothetical protein [Polyangium sp. 15x6]|uniref:hypothetical protein n=1 Tax=Polyangium sp. 15x6 TaxID=3042687 RepID=UPI00249BE4BD|nr:hypothetical protein [Polyangium sp. 15x6]MDI3283501.1 hypothetical protein [Polyangium sp. 15x6]
MSTPQRSVYIISDLHIGGRYPEPNEPGQRGFRINTRVDALTRFVRTLGARRAEGLDVELVINGDFLDFLAEEVRPGTFVPFIADPGDALRVLGVIVEQDKSLFDELRAFVGRGGRLTLLLGNHDVELALPHVRAEFLRLLGADASPARISFLYDGEAYAIGDALIEHGNRYDGFNTVDHGALREVRSLQSRGQPIPPDFAFPPPAGSQLVSSVMNEIKRQYRFVDLLKPETEAVLPILLVLEPGYGNKILTVGRLKREAEKHKPAQPAMPRHRGDLSAVEGTDGASPLTLAEMLTAAMPADAAREFLTNLPATSTGGELSAIDDVRFAGGLLRLWASGMTQELEQRLPKLLTALRALQKDRSFERSVETQPEYLKAATELVRGGYRFVIFGHTHLPKAVDLGRGRMYLNSGTWADTMRVPSALLDAEGPEAMAMLRDFLSDLAANRIASYVEFNPHYVRLDVRGSRVERALLCNPEEEPI